MPKSFKATYISLFVATAAAMLGMGIIEPILPIYAHRMGASGLMVGLIFSGFAVSRGFFAPVVGQYSDSRGRRHVILIGLAFFIVLSVAYTWFASPWWLMLIRTLQGLSSVLITPVAQSYVGDITPRGKEGKYMNLFFVSFFCGNAIGPAMGGFLSDRFNIDMPFYAMAVLAAVALGLVYVLVPESPASTRERRGARVSAREAFKKVFRDRHMQGVLALMSSRGFYRWGFNTFFPVFAINEIAMSKTQVGFILSFYMLAGALIQYPAGLISDRFLKQRKEIIFYGGLLSPIMMFFVPFAHGFSALIWITLTMGISSAVARASAIAIRTERGRVHGMGVTTGAFTTSLSAGQVLGPLMFGAVADFSNLHNAFYLGGAVGLLGSFVSYAFLRSVERDGEPALD